MSEPTTVEPITLDGWYEHTDGTWGEYAWSGDPHMPRCLRVADRPETQAERDQRYADEERCELGKGAL